MPNGGTIIVGVSENEDFHIVGIGGTIAEYEAGIAATARNFVEPPVNVTFYSLQLEAGNVVIAEVQGVPLQHRPVRFNDKAYLRQADGDYEMSEQEIQHLELIKTQREKRTQPDKSVVPGTSADDLDADLVAAYIKTARSGSRRAANWNDEMVLYNTGVTTKSGEITLAGLYALGTAPQREFPQLAITAAIELPFTTGGPRTRDLAHFTGPIPDLLDQALEWVTRNTRPDLIYAESGHALDKSELPMKAVREIIANALVHRNIDPITDSKLVEIRLRDDVLSITSPGGLWGVSESQLGHPGAKSAVNPVLYQVCKNVRGADGYRIIEGEGGGIIEAINEMRAAHLRTPRFLDKGVQFTVLLSRHTLLSSQQLEWIQKQEIESKTSSEALAVLASMQSGEAWSKSRIRTHFNISNEEASRIISQIREHKDVQQQGHGRGRVYLMQAAREPEVRSTLNPSDDIPMTKNGPLVLKALESGALSIRELKENTGLGDSPTRYALSWLLEHRFIEMIGKQGDPFTTYALLTT